MSKLKKIDIQNTIISITSIHEEDYIWAKYYFDVLDKKSTFVQKAK